MSWAFTTAYEGAHNPDERSARSYRRSSRQPLIYLGGNVFPFFTKPKDYTKFFAEEFEPTSKQYLLMGNIGFMGVAGFGIDMFFGAGVAYNQFRGNSTSWNIEELVIEDALLQYRKPDYFSFSMRMGMSIGIGYAKP